MAVNAFISFFDKADGESIPKGYNWDIPAGISSPNG